MTCDKCKYFKNEIEYRMLVGKNMKLENEKNEVLKCTRFPEWIYIHEKHHCGEFVEVETDNET